MELYLSLEEKGVMGGDHLADVQPNHIYSFCKDSRKVSHFLWKYMYIKNIILLQFILSLFWKTNKIYILGNHNASYYLASHVLNRRPWAAFLVPPFGFNGSTIQASLQCFWETQPWSVSKKADETSLLCLYHSNWIKYKPIFIQAFKGGNQINKSAQQTGTEREGEREERERERGEREREREEERERERERVHCHGWSACLCFRCCESGRVNADPSWEL